MTFLGKKRLLEIPQQTAAQTQGGAADLINLGNTLIVSKTGDDARASAESLNNHYFTIAAALADASAGDVIVIYAGTYAENLSIGVGVTLDFRKGAELSGAITVNADTTIVGGEHSSNLAQNFAVQNGAELYLYDAEVVNTFNMGIDVQDGKAYAYNCLFDTSNDCISTAAVADLYVLATGCKMKSATQALDLRANFNISNCYLESTNISLQPVDIEQFPVSLYEQSFTDCVIKCANSASALDFTGDATQIKALLAGVKTNGTLPYDAQLQQGFNIESIEL